MGEKHCDILDEACEYIADDSNEDRHGYPLGSPWLATALREYVADLRARAVPESTRYVAWVAGGDSLTIEYYGGIWKWHTWRGDGPACIASGLAGTMQAAIAAAEEASE